MGAGGRPSKYYQIVNPTVLTLIQYFVRKGLTDKDIAQKLQISESTFNLWKKNHEEFSEALKTAKNCADDLVEAALFQKAIKGDTTAMIFWLKNRRRNEWTDTRFMESKTLEKGLKKQNADLSEALEVIDKITKGQLSDDTSKDDS